MADKYLDTYNAKVRRQKAGYSTSDAPKKKKKKAFANDAPQKFYFNGQQVGSREEMEKRRTTRAEATPDIGLGGTGTQQPLLQAERERFLENQRLQNVEFNNFKENFIKNNPTATDAQIQAGYNETLPSSVPQSTAVPTMQDLAQTFQAKEEQVAAENPQEFQKRQRARNLIMPIFNSVVDFTTSMSQFLPDFLQLGTKKTAKVQSLEQEFLNWDKSITEGIDLVETGEMDAAAVRRSIESAIIATQLLYEESKGKGQLNARYWLTDGREIESQVESQLSILQNRLMELNNAEIKYQAQKQSINYAELGF